MGKENKLSVALAKEACPACARVVDGPILMNTKLTKKDAENVENMHGKVIGYLDKPCESCQNLMSQGFLLIGVDLDKTEDETNPYRSGHQWVISNDAVDRIFKDIDKKYGYAFITKDIAEKIGLPVKDFEKGEHNEETNI